MVFLVFLLPFANVIMAKQIPGTTNNDNLTGTADIDLINGGRGNDTLSGLGGNDIINGGAEMILFWVGEGDDYHHWWKK